MKVTVRYDVVRCKVPHHAMVGMMVGKRYDNM